MNQVYDPCEVLPAEMFTYILLWLKDKDILSCALVNQAWRNASVSKEVWQELCDVLWRDKVYVPQKIRELKATDPQTAYKNSIEDSKRSVITEEELCGFDWYFRFKEDEGAWYADSDPWINGRAPSHHKYHTDGKIEITGEFSGAAPNDRTWSWLEDEEVEQGTWIQISHYPAYKVSRMSNWGWIHQSELAVLFSFNIPPKGTVSEYEDINLPSIPSIGSTWRGRSIRIINNDLPQSILNFLSQYIGGDIQVHMNRDLGYEYDEEDDDEYEDQYLMSIEEDEEDNTDDDHDIEEHTQDDGDQDIIQDDNTDNQ